MTEREPPKSIRFTDEAKEALKRAHKLVGGTVNSLVNKYVIEGAKNERKLRK